MKTPIYTIDIETDPFLYGTMVVPFAIGFYDGVEFVTFWGKHCRQKMRDYVENLAPGIIYIHNGGRFDIHFLMEWVLGNPMRIIGSRIVLAHMGCTDGWHEIRDSYAIMPFPLGEYKGDVQKLKIDIDKLKKENRNKHKSEIIEYLKMDCVSLWHLCTAFCKKFGSQLTIGSTAMRELKKFHTFTTLEKDMDIFLRKLYFYGGRNQYFRKGKLPGKWKVFDVNSMYPHVMQSFNHPIGLPSSDSETITQDTCFITVTGKNEGVFPTRIKGGSIRFDVDYGTFHITRHEWDAAMECGLFRPDRIESCVNFVDRGNFAEFVDHYYAARLKAKAEKDETNSLFNKFVLNSAYGKFPQRPDDYRDYTISLAGDDLTSEGWEPSATDDQYAVWSRKSDSAERRYNVATGASITGAARSVLIRALHKAVNPIYCDTDSIICENLPGVDIDATRLGAWKLETSGDIAYIAGKKTYVLYDGDTVVKIAHKGVKVTGQDIQDVCAGKTVISMRDAPTFKLNGSHVFISRRVRMT